MNIAAYLRVSTEDQDYNNQLQPVLDYCKAKWWPEPVIYAENESAWKVGHQRELAKLLRELRTGRRRYDYLVVFALDRLTRGKVGAVFQLLESFELLGCKVVSIQEPWLCESETRDILVPAIAWAANYESNRKSQNTKAGLARARANGKTLGRPKGSKDKTKRKRTGYLLRYAKGRRDS